MRFQLNISLGGSPWISRTAARIGHFIREHQVTTTHPPAVGDSVRTADCLWRYSPPMEELGARWVPHRVMRWTQDAAEVEAHPFLAANNRRHVQRTRTTRTYWVDRDDLDRLGFARVRSRKTIFFTNPQASNKLVTTLEALTRLGLWIPYTEDELKQAFRRCALRDHPDAGGSDARFQRLQEDYQRAMRALNHCWWESGTSPDEQQHRHGVRAR